MANFWEELESASFRGVPFLLENSSTKGGRKTATHEFINTDTRTIEDLGRLQKVFKISALTTSNSPSPTDNSSSTAIYIRNRNNLVNALERGGTATLVHPYYGSHQVVAKPYTLIENFKEAGVAKFEMIFERVAPKRRIRVRAATTTTIATNGDIVYNNLGEDLTNVFTASSGNNYDNAIAMFEDIPSSFNESSDIFVQGLETVNQFTTVDLTLEQQYNQVLGKINNFKASINDFTNNIRKFILAPSRLVNSVRSLFTSIVDLASTPKFAVLMLEDLFQFGADFPEFVLNTAERIQRKLNEVNVFNLIQIGALAEAYRQTSLITFTDILELNEIMPKLETQFNRVMPLITNPRTYTQLQLLRNLTVEFIDTQKLTIRELITIATPDIPVQVLTYQYYGNLDDYERILEVNAIKDVSFTSGQLQIFTEKPEIL